MQNSYNSYIPEIDICLVWIRVDLQCQKSLFHLAVSIATDEEGETNRF